MKNLIATSILLMASGFVFADAKVIITNNAGGTKGQSSFAMDIAASSNFKGFQFDIDVAGIGTVDLSACTSSLPKQMTVSCKRISGDKIRVLAVDIASVGTDLKAGQVAIGLVNYTGSPSLEVSNVIFADKAGEEISSSAVTSK